MDQMDVPELQKPVVPPKKRLTDCYTYSAAQAVSAQMGGSAAA